MLRKTMPEKVIYVTWLSVAMSFCWPLPLSSSKNQVFAYRLLQIVSIISILLVLLSLIYSLHLHSNNIFVLCKYICLAIGMCQSIGQVAICSMKHNNLQHIVGELMTCVEEAKQYEKEILQKYIAKCEVFYGCCIIIIYITASGVLLGPIFLETPFPFEVEYPFSINYTLIYVIMYFHQFIAILQCTAHVCLSGFGALLLWFLAVRFECLAVDFQKCSDVNMMTDCIKKQLRLRRYAENISNCFRFIIAYAIIVSTVSIIICGLLLTTNLVPPVVKLQFILVSGTVLIEVYMYAWPAEYVMDTSINVSRCVYNLLWYDHTLALQKYLLNVLAFQKPVTISVTLLLPELSLRYFCAYLTNAFSIFTTVRAVVVED